MEKMLKRTYGRVRRRRVRHRDAHLAQGHPQLQIDWPTNSPIGPAGPGASGVSVGAPLVRIPRMYRLPTVNPSGGAGSLSDFTATGTMTISATLVPEPSTLIGLLTGALGLAAYAWRRRRR